jgi:hypothetical protein
MGLVATGPSISVAIRPAQDKLMDALATASARVVSGQADAAIARWFGNDALPQKKKLGTTINRFRSNINVKTIHIGFEAMVANPKFAKVNQPNGKVKIIEPKFTRSAGTNAAAFRARDPNVALDLGDALSHVPKGEAPVELGEGYKQLPLLLPLVGGQIDASGWIQSQFETLVHELSHLLLGTIDVEFTDGTTAYGTQAAEELATFGSRHAFQNAENWGIFIEAAGVQRCS